ncbi:hypothetical protein WICPIJ_006075, partial [Wickerhamomyces pijperi]
YTALNHKYGWLLSNVSFILLALSIIVFGSFASLSSPFNEKSKVYAKHHRKLLQSGTITDVSDEDDTDESVIKPNKYIPQTIDTKYAIALPFIAAVFLLTLNYLIKNVDTEMITSFSSKYTLLVFSTGLIRVVKFCSVAGVELLGFNGDVTKSIFPLIRISFAVEDTEDDIYSSGYSSNPLFEDSDKERPYFDQLKEQLQKVKSKTALIFEFPSALNITQQFCNLYISSFDILSILISAPLIFLYVRFESNHWMISNFVASVMATAGILSLKFDNFTTGSLVLVGLFFYDIYFVFGSDVMLNVAKGINAPMMIKIPSGINYENLSPDQDIPLGMLGLGDIVIPGAFIALCLRYDVFRHYSANPEYHFEVFGGVRKIYFTTGLISYVIGLILTFVALVYTKAAQPALLYLSPSLIIGTIFVPWLIGDFKNAFAYEESEKNLIQRKEKEASDENEIKSDPTFVEN